MCSGQWKKIVSRPQRFDSLLPRCLQGMTFYPEVFWEWPLDQPRKGPSYSHPPQKGGLLTKETNFCCSSKWMYLWPVSGNSCGKHQVSGNCSELSCLEVEWCGFGENPLPEPPPPPHPTPSMTNWSDIWPDCLLGYNIPVSALTGLLEQLLHWWDGKWKSVYDLDGPRTIPDSAKKGLSGWSTRFCSGLIPTSPSQGRSRFGQDRPLSTNFLEHQGDVNWQFHVYSKGATYGLPQARISDWLWSVWATFCFEDISPSMTEVPLTRLISGKVTGTKVIPLLSVYRSMSVVCG